MTFLDWGRTLLKTATSSLTRLPPICPDSADWFEQMATGPWTSCDGARLQARLYDQFRVEVPILEWQGRLFLLISIQDNNTAEDVDCLEDALAASLPA